MTDKELLQLAAEAAGIEIMHFSSKGEAMISMGGGPESCFVRRWNTLEDDGDALRLAVRLYLCVSVDCPRSGCISVLWGDNGEFWVDNSAPVGGDDCAATRRAITRAAAEIARARREGK